MHLGTLALAAVLAAGAVARRDHLTLPVRLAAAVGVVALALSGSGLVALPSAETIVRDAAAGLGSLTYVVVGAFAFAETGAFVGLVAPGELAVVLGGVAAGHGTISLPWLVGVVWACAFAGDLVSYTLGRRLGRGVLLIHGAAFGVTEARLARLERMLAEHGGKTLVLGRFLGFVRPLAPFLVGASGTAARRFVPVSAFASGLWAATFCCLGYVFWASLSDLLAIVERGSLALGVVVALVAAVVLVRRRMRAPRADQPPGTGQSPHSAPAPSRPSA